MSAAACEHQAPVVSGVSAVAGFPAFLESRRLLIPFVVTCLLACYGYELCNFSYSIDEELVMGGLYPGHAWTEQGRFGIEAVKTIIGDWDVLPFHNLFLSLLFLGLSSLIWCYGLYRASWERIEGYAPFLVFSSLFLSFPVNVHFLQFNTYNVEVSLGMALVPLSLLFALPWAADEGSRLNALWAVLLLTFSFGIYQSFPSMFVAGACIFTILNCRAVGEGGSRSRKPFGLLLRYCSILLAAFVLYMVCSALLRSMLPPAGYVDSFLRWGKTDSWVIASALYDYTRNFVTKQLWHGTAIIQPTLLLGLAILAYLSGRKGWRGKLASVVAMFGLLMSPFLLTYALGMSSPLRASQVLPLFVAGVWFLAYHFAQWRLLRGALLAITVLFLLYHGQSTTEMFFGEHLRAQQDVTLANRIADRIARFESADQPAHPVLFVGYRRSESQALVIREEALGTSFFGWDGGDVQRTRLMCLMRTLGYQYRPPSIEQALEGIRNAEAMPSWPHKDSIAVQNNMLIVKLAEPGH